MDLLFLVVWVLYFLLVEGVYNLYLYPHGFTFSKKHKYTLLYFAVAAIFPLLYVKGQFAILYLTTLFVFVAVVAMVSVLWGLKSQKRGYWIRTRSVEVLFQQAMVCSLYLNLNSSLIAGLIFGIVHIPIVFINRVKNKYWLVLISFIAGYFFYKIIAFHQYGYLLSYSVHFIFYMIYSWHEKEDDLE